MALGYDGKLYILAFDHRGSFQKKMFGIEGDPTPERDRDDRRRQASDLRGDGARRSRAAPRPAPTGVLVDEQFGSDIPERAREHGLKLAMPVEKSGQNEFDFEYGEDFARPHREASTRTSPRCWSVTTPTTTRTSNERQLGRLKRLADWLHANGRKFLFELLVPATDEQLASVDGDATATTPSSGPS